MSTKNSDYYFLQGGGEMGEMIRAKDWSKTSLGDPVDWPLSLRITLGILLKTKFPMFLWWGNELACFYNDAYRPSLGNEGKHPSILGMPAKEAWTEIWDIIKPLIDKVMNEEEAIWFEDMLVPIYRNGKIEDVYWTFSYSPVPSDNGKVAGVLVTCTETTEKVNTLRKIEESDEKLRSLIQNAPFPIGVYTGKEMRIEVANESIIKAWGKGNEVKGKLFNELMPELESQEIFEQLDDVFTSGIPFHAYNRYVTLIIDGQEQPYYYNYSFTPLFDSLGKVYGVMNTAADVTELNLAKQKTEESKRLYEAITQNTPDLIYVFDLNYRFTYANEALLNMWGLTWENAIGKGMLALGYQPWHAEMHEREIDEVIATKKNIRGEVSFPHATLGVRIYDYIFAPVIDQEGKVVSIAGTTRDITQLIEANKQIEESEQNIRSMVLQSPIGICVIDADTLISEIVNDSFIEIAGKPYEEIAGKHYWETFAEAKPYYESALNKVIAGGESFYANEVEMMLIRHGKEEIIYVTFVYAPLKNIDGIVKKVAIWVLDNTSQVIIRRRIEEADKRFRNTVKQAPVGITILRGPKYIVEMANDAYLQLVDRKEDEFVGQPLFNVLPEVQESVQPLLDNVLSSGVPYHGNEVPVPINRYGKQGICYFDFLYHPLKEEDGNITGIIVTVTDVTEKVEVRKKTEQNEERLNIVVEASELGTWELNLKTMAPHYSKRYLEIIGGYKDEVSLTHEQLLRHLHPDDMDLRDKAFKEALATGNLHYRARLIWIDNSLHWMEGKGKVFYDSANKPEKMIGTIRDITAEKKHQQKLEESEQRFRNLIMQSPVAKAILKGEDHIVEMANQALLKHIWMKDESEVIGKKILDVFPELEKQKYLGLLHDVFTSGKKHSEKESLISFNGQDGVRNYYVDFEYAPMFSDTNTISGIKITAIDVTEKVETRKKIEESERRFRSLAESMPQLVWETDAQGNSLFSSGRWEEYTGIVPVGEAEWKAIVHPDDLEKNTKTWMHSLATGDLYRSDLRIKSKSGDYRWHAVIGQPVVDKENKIVKWVGAFTDIHTEKAFTQELEKQVAQRTKELGDTNIELAKKNKELQTFAYISSHDLQEPLRKIQTFASQIREKESQNLSEIGNDKFRRMESAANRMQTLIDDLLTYSRTNTQERKFEKVNLSIIVNEVKEDLHEEFQQKQAIVEIGQMCDANIIPFQFRQLLFNLLNNSLKFSKANEAPHIKIKSETGEGAAFKNPILNNEIKYCHLSISDNGIGFDQQYSEKIFEVFQRLHAKDDYSGTGIGLSIVKRIVENHNGVITANGELNKGARFDIYIPVT